MTVGALISHKNDADNGTILTFIVPSRRGCNLKCSFCFISQRGEKSEYMSVSPYFYEQFISEVTQKEKVSDLCIQGHEPLLPESLEYTMSILRESHRNNLMSGLVTNGTYLGQSLGELSRFPPNKIAVSLDAASPKSHDRQRGVSGAWRATVNSLQSATQTLTTDSEIIVASVLMPKRHQQLEEMPKLLKQLRIKSWVVTPLLKVGKDNTGQAVSERRKMWQDLTILKREADRHLVEFAVDDEFNLLNENEDYQSIVDINELRIQRLPKKADLFRLLPSGQCSRGLDILMQVKSHAPRWIPGKEHAGDFIQRMRAS